MGKCFICIFVIWYIVYDDDHVDDDGNGNGNGEDDEDGDVQPPIPHPRPPIRQSNKTIQYDVFKKIKVSL